jgi:hypothetical protein
VIPVRSSDGYISLFMIMLRAPVLDLIVADLVLPYLSMCHDLFLILLNDVNGSTLKVSYLLTVYAIAIFSPSSSATFIVLFCSARVFFLTVLQGADVRRPHLHS